MYHLKCLSFLCGNENIQNLEENLESQVGRFPAGLLRDYSEGNAK
jgi:hypothetical protein